MLALKQWGLALCSASAVCSLVLMLAPKTSTANILRLAVSLFFLSAVFSPVLLGSELSFEYMEQAALARSDGVAEGLAQRADGRAALQVGEALEAQVADILREFQLPPQKTVAVINRMGDGSITINEVLLTLPHGAQSSGGEIKERLEKTLGLSFSITYAEPAGDKGGEEGAE